MVAAPGPMTTIPTVRTTEQERVVRKLSHRPRRRDRSLRTIRTGRSPVIGRDSPTRNVAADPFEPPVRPSRVRDDDPFLPADDPLSAEAWQLELDEASPGGDDEATLPEFDLGAAPPPRRARRQPPAARSGSRARSRGPANAPDAADPAPRASAAGALVPASRSRCHGWSLGPRSWRTRRRWH